MFCPAKLYCGQAPQVQLALRAPREVRLQRTLRRGSARPATAGRPCARCREPLARWALTVFKPFPKRSLLRQRSSPAPSDVPGRCHGFHHGVVPHRLPAMCRADDNACTRARVPGLHRIDSLADRSAVQPLRRSAGDGVRAFRSRHAHDGMHGLPPRASRVHARCRLWSF